MLCAQSSAACHFTSFGGRAVVKISAEVSPAFWPGSRPMNRPPWPGHGAPRAGTEMLLSSGMKAPWWGGIGRSGRAHAHGAQVDAKQLEHLLHDSAGGAVDHGQGAA